LPTASRGGALYLPFVLGEACASARERRPRDWVLLLDVSGSMAAPAGPPFGFANRWEAARDIARAVLETLEPDADRVAIIQFGEEHELVESPGGLQACCDIARSELATNFRRLRNGHPWAAMERARWHIETAVPTGGSRRPGIVVITDMRSGDLGPGEASRMLALSSATLGRGIAIYAAGIGEVVDRAYLTGWTGIPARILDGSRLRFPLGPAIHAWLHCSP
jgi:Mg-chelatase subunit ChlD